MPNINVKKTFLIECSTKELITLIASTGQMITHLEKRKESHGDVSLEEIAHTKSFAKTLKDALKQ